MRADEDIKRDVEEELGWDPDIDATDIGVAVNNGVVTLTGFVRSYMQKYDAERVTQLKPRPWLAQIALNLARNHVRAARHHYDIDDVTIPQLPTAEDGPVSLAERHDDRRMWSRLLAGLPPKYRLPVALRHVEGLSYDEVSQTLDRPVGSVKSDVHRGIALLRAAYDAEQREVAQKEAV